MKAKISVSPWAALAAGLLFYCSDETSLIPLLLPVLFHELGHLVLLRLFHCRVTALRWELSGLCIRCASDPGPKAMAFTALAGPLAGIVYAFAAARLGPSGELSAGISLLLSAFNLIPAPPLDGWQIVSALLDSRRAAAVGVCASLVVFLLGLFLFLQGRGAALVLAGVLLVARWAISYGSSSPISPD